jgi:hypothetical protein
MYAFIDLDVGAITNHSEKNTRNVPSVIEPTMWPPLKVKFQVLKHQLQT